MGCRLPALAALLAIAVSMPAAGYTIYLKDGSTIDAEGPYTVQGDEAILILRNGTRSSLPLAEIDVATTERNNRGGLSDALVLQDGALVDLETARQGAPAARETLGSMIARGEATASSRPARTETEAAADPAATAAANGRRPLRDEAALAVLRTVFMDEGVAEVGIYEGAGSDRPLVEVTTDSEAGVLRGLLVAAVALQAAHEQRGDAVRALDLRFVTSNRQAGGDFFLTPELARALMSGSIEPSAFYVEHVQF